MGIRGVRVCVCVCVYEGILCKAAQAHVSHTIVLQVFNHLGAGKDEKVSAKNKTETEESTVIVTSRVDE